MYGTMRTENTGKILVDMRELRAILSCGRVTAERIAESAGASIKIGKRRLYNVKKIEKYLADTEPLKGA